MSDGKIAIRVKGLSKSFRLPHERHSELRQRIANIGRSQKGYEVQQVLDDVSFEIKKGEFFGIVGRNGSGKSTLLKTIAGIYSPDSGKVSVSGKLVPFIELGVGFNPELTGRENVYLNGALLGFSRKEMNAMYDEIVGFAELERFMDQKLKNYSSGMQVRLAFSIAIRAQGDILLLDEVLAVGDAAFQQKCFDYFEKLKQEKKTVILVTHSMTNVERFCNRALLLDSGKIAFMGSNYEVADRYRDLFSSSKDRSPSSGATTAPGNRAEFLQMVVSQEGKEKDIVVMQKPFTVSVYLKSKERMSKCNLVLRMRDANDNLVFAKDTASQLPEGVDMDTTHITRVDFTIDNYFAEGSYRFNVIGKGTDQAGSRDVIIDVQNIGKLRVSEAAENVRSMFYPPTIIKVGKE